MSRCEDGFYPVLSNKKCLECHSSCATCSGPAISECLTCNKQGSSDYFVPRNSSTAKIAPGTCQGEISDFLTSVCHASCKACEVVANNCLECAQNPSEPYFFFTDHAPDLKICHKIPKGADNAWAICKEGKLGVKGKSYAWNADLKRCEGLVVILIYSKIAERAAINAR